MSESKIRRVWLPLGLTGVIALALGVVASQYRQHEHPEPTAAPVTDLAALASIEDFAFIDQHGVRHASRDWRGKVVVINFWASWCPPCVHEIPLLNALQAQYEEAGVRVIGVAVDEAKAVEEFLAEHRMAYPTMVPQTPLHSIGMLRRAGNTAGGLPYTLFIDREGSIVHRHAGELKRQQAIQWLEAIVDG